MSCIVGMCLFVLFGCTETLDFDPNQYEQYVRERIQIGMGFDDVIDALGQPDSIDVDRQDLKVIAYKLDLGDPAVFNRIENKGHFVSGVVLVFGEGMKLEHMGFTITKIS